MNTTQKSIITTILSAITTLAFAGSNTAIEDYSSGIGLTTSYTAFAGTPAQSQIISLGQIWIGDVKGLVSQLDNAFYNDQTNFPDGTPVLAFGPSNLHPIVEVQFSVDVTHANFIIYDIETIDAVRVLGFDDQGTEIYNSGPLNGDAQFEFLFDAEFNPPIRELMMEAVNQDGLMLSPIQIAYNEHNACPADFTNDGTLNFFDVSAFLSAFTSNDPIADFTDDGSYNFFDVSAFLAAFAAGCP